MPKLKFTSLRTSVSHFHARKVTLDMSSETFKKYSKQQCFVLHFKSNPESFAFSAANYGQSKTLILFTGSQTILGDHYISH